MVENEKSCFFCIYLKVVFDSLAYFKDTSSWKRVAYLKLAEFR